MINTRCDLLTKWTSIVLFTQWNVSRVELDFRLSANSGLICSTPPARCNFKNAAASIPTSAESFVLSHSFVVRFPVPKIDLQSVWLSIVRKWWRIHLHIHVRGRFKAGCIFLPKNIHIMHPWTYHSVIWIHNVHFYLSFISTYPTLIKQCTYSYANWFYQWFSMLSGVAGFGGVEYCLCR